MYTFAIVALLGLATVKLVIVMVRSTFLPHARGVPGPPAAKPDRTGTRNVIRSD